MTKRDSWKDVVERYEKKIALAPDNEAMRRQLAVASWVAASDYSTAAYASISHNALCITLSDADTGTVEGPLLVVAATDHPASCIRLEFHTQIGKLALAEAVRMEDWQSVFRTYVSLLLEAGQK